MKSLYRKKGSYLFPRLTLLTFETLILIATGWLLLFNGAQHVNNWWGWNLHTGDPLRNELMFSLILIVYFRMLVTMFYLLKRTIPWEEAFTIPLAFSIYYLGFPLLSFFENKSVNGWDMAFVLIFLFGSYLNTYSEWQRNQWKKSPENKGKLYTKGLFRYSMHINYFGDLLWVLALALLTWNVWSFIIPAGLFLLFAFYNIPLLDRHLEDKYTKDFYVYQQTTKKFIPYLY